jgi:hypothetical protein
METNYTFKLPRGYLDSQGNRHQTGTMRLATARDEIETASDPRVQENEAYLSVLLLSRVVTRLGDLDPVGPAVIEGLFASDFAFLEDLYERLNAAEPVVLSVSCPNCSERFHVKVAPLE